MDPVRVELEARSSDLDLIDSDTLVATSPACAFPLRFEADKMDYHFTSEPPEGTERVVYAANGWPLPDDTTGLRHSEDDGFPLDYRFSTAGWHRITATALSGTGEETAVCVRWIRSTTPETKRTNRTVVPRPQDFNNMGPPAKLPKQ